MIELTKLNNKKFTVNADIIEFVEETPDTVVTLTTGHKIIVKETRQEVTNLVKLYRKSLYNDILEQIKEG
ncbi:MAG: flagellar FlbD family protein [Lachnospira sp.]|nr:flagellar FlbD family protein [Lachnospira sp.]